MKFTEKTCNWVKFTENRTSLQACFCEFCEIFLNSHSIELLLKAISDFTVLWPNTKIYTQLPIYFYLEEQLRIRSLYSGQKKLGTWHFFAFWIWFPRIEWYSRYRCNYAFKILKPQCFSLREKRPYTEFFWSVFFRIWTECGEIRSISPYSVRMRENTKIRTRNTPNRTLFTQCLLLCL